MKVIEQLRLYDSNSARAFSVSIEEPDECPLCHFSIRPTKLKTALYENEGIKYVI